MKTNSALGYGAAAKQATGLSDCKERGKRLTVRELRNSRPSIHSKRVGKETPFFIIYGDVLQAWLYRPVINVAETGATVSTSDFLSEKSSMNLASCFIDEPKKCNAFFLTALRL